MRAETWPVGPLHDSAASIDAENEPPDSEAVEMTNRRFRSVVASVALAALLVTAGCVGSLSGGSPTTDAPESSPSPTADTPTADTADDASGDATAAEIFERVQEKQRSVEGYSATVSYRTNISLTNGSSLSRQHAERLAVQYGNDSAPSFYRRVSFDDGDRRVEIANADHFVRYNATSERYRYTERSGEDRFGQHYSLDEVNWAGSPEALFRENDATYEGTETVNGREAYVVTFEAKEHPNGPESTATAYFAEQTYWFDTETGILLKHVAHKPVQRFNRAISEYRDPRNDTGGFRDDNGDDAVYFEHKVRTTEVSNLTVNPAFDAGTFEFDPPADAQPVGAPDDDEPEDDE
ncbi:hypothetical protein M0R88_07955 [Halorussus gelatinilyticus]|uniref:Outer membrane lipoprotein-sorting protein n=1 Tax=Halorussus gelatinilyticus TaxID=2937524 RepID=A0A8U0ILK9_9EURY|nr:hypothetical protein [Halorussus gelatinilyticus]UPW02017.1 hypothetical protein M0R88_07955 [Halorussus gelatinilyticus]